VPSVIQPASVPVVVTSLLCGEQTAWAQQFSPSGCNDARQANQDQVQSRRADHQQDEEQDEANGQQHHRAPRHDLSDRHNCTLPRTAR